MDAVYFIDPFDSVETSKFQETGSMFLHDYRIMRHKSKYNFVVERFKHVAFGVNPCWTGTGMERDNHLDHIGESSLVLFDRGRHRKTFRELSKLHTNLTKVEYMYHVFWGDKETYWLGNAKEIYLLMMFAFDELQQLQTQHVDGLYGEMQCLGMNLNAKEFLVYARKIKHMCSNNILTNLQFRFQA